MSGKLSIDQVLQACIEDQQASLEYWGGDLPVSPDPEITAILRDASDRMQVARDMHDLLQRGGVPTWTAIHAVIELLCGPIRRVKRCAKCGGEGRLLLGTQKTMACPSCEDGYTKGGDV